MKIKHIISALLFLSLLIFSHFDSYSQSLSPDRIRHIKECTFKITIDGTQSIGTGFFVGNNGTFLTCWHVIEPAMIRDPQTHTITGMRNIYITLSSGEKMEAGVFTNLLNTQYENAIAFDYCVLRVAVNNRIFPFLRVGDFDDLKEGDEVYTCGYPLGIPQQFISKGIASTKYLDTTNKIGYNGTIKSKPRNQCLLDMTLNKGNSGGAIIRLGQTESEDEVIGIADFIINPIGGNAEALSDLLRSKSGGVFISGIDTNLLFATIIQVLDNTSIGISGCVSINHAKDVFSKL